MAELIYAYDPELDAILAERNDHKHCPIRVRWVCPHGYEWWGAAYGGWVKVVDYINEQPAGIEKQQLPEDTQGEPATRFQTQRGH